MNEASHPAATEGGRRPSGPGFWRLLAIVLAFTVSAYGLGLLGFVRSIPSEVLDPDEPTDAIVVLTGGSQRLATGLRLLSEGRAGRLFISGVNREVELGRLLAATPQASPAGCCIEIGHAADDTVGNALETAQWVRDQGFHSLRLVTASYHMPRSLLEFRYVMPDVRLVPNPVFPAGFQLDDWWRHRGTLALLVAEYNKYLFALVRHPYDLMLHHNTGTKAS